MCIRDRAGGEVGLASERGPDHGGAAAMVRDQLDGDRGVRLPIPPGPDLSHAPAANLQIQNVLLHEPHTVVLGGATNPGVVQCRPTVRFGVMIVRFLSPV